MEEEDNLTKQVDEIEALSSIYPEEWKTEDESFRTYTISITEGTRTATLLVTLPPEYPTASPPYYLMTAPWMKEENKNELYNELEQIYLDHAGESILHLWIEKLREFLQEKYPADIPVSDEVQTEEKVIGKKLPIALDLSTTVSECPQIVSSEPFTERRSTFQGHVAAVTNASEVKVVLAKLCENRKIAQATHNIYAYRIHSDEAKMWIQDCDDDGETHAGSRVLHLLQILDVKNVVVVVTRWFGGILLGGDRFKHINNAARDALELGGYVSATKASAGSDDSGAKGKKTKKK